MRDYINKRHTSKLTLQQLKQTPFRYPHHSVENVNKPGKLNIVFEVGAKFQSTLLNENLFKGPDLLRSLIGVLIRL